MKKCKVSSCFIASTYGLVVSFFLGQRILFDYDVTRSVYLGITSSQVDSEENTDSTYSHSDYPEHATSKTHTAVRMGIYNSSQVSSPEHTSNTPGYNTSSQVALPEHTINKTRAIVHMGIYKTGSTTIQHQSRRYKQQLKEDGYEMPHIRTTARQIINQVRFASCFLPVIKSQKKK